MSIGIIIALILFISIFALFAKNKEGNSNENDVKDDSENNEIEELFFKEVSSGKEKYRFLKISSQFDLMFIKSLFQSESIPYYVEFEKISRTRPGMYVGDLGNYNLLYILDDDYDDALEVVKNYMQTKKHNKENISENKENIRNLSEVIIGNWKVPSATDIDGIEIMYKENDK
jgi:ABC-type antimicrobial peptide transport system permease subunit